MRASVCYWGSMHWQDVKHRCETGHTNTSASSQHRPAPDPVSTVLRFFTRPSWVYCLYEEFLYSCMCCITHQEQVYSYTLSNHCCIYYIRVFIYRKHTLSLLYSWFRCRLLWWLLCFQCPQLFLETFINLLKKQLKLTGLCMWTMSNMIYFKWWYPKQYIKWHKNEEAHFPPERMLDALIIWFVE